MQISAAFGPQNYERSTTVRAAQNPGNLNTRPISMKMLSLLPACAPRIILFRIMASDSLIRYRCARLQLLENAFCLHMNMKLCKCGENSQRTSHCLEI